LIAKIAVNVLKRLDKKSKLIKARLLEIKAF